ncbi:MAG: hypothetical protein ACLT2Z_06430 [Eubacterium sp.]
MLHLPAIAHEIDLILIYHLNEISAKTQPCHLAPAGPTHMEDPSACSVYAENNEHGIRTLQKRSTGQERLLEKI